MKTIDGKDLFNEMKSDNVNHGNEGLKQLIEKLVIEGHSVIISKDCDLQCTNFFSGEKNLAEAMLKIENIIPIGAPVSIVMYDCAAEMYFINETTITKTRVRIYKNCITVDYNEGSNGCYVFRRHNVFRNRDVAIAMMNGLNAELIAERK